MCKVPRGLPPGSQKGDAKKLGSIRLSVRQGLLKPGQIGRSSQIQLPTKLESSRRLFAERLNRKMLGRTRTPRKSRSRREVRRQVALCGPSYPQGARRQITSQPAREKGLELKFVSNSLRSV